MDKNLYFYDSNGTKQGPVNASELQDYVTKGHIIPETILEKNGKQCKAAAIKSLRFEKDSNKEEGSPVVAFVIIGIIVLVCLWGGSDENGRLQLFGAGYNLLFLAVVIIGILCGIKYLKR
ncbi:MAG: hypothetical protein Q4G68_11310 [Planctomycetia bacterium]|nr:hypothetical protein [Planctomycetia bacterium]